LLSTSLTKRELGWGPDTRGTAAKNTNDLQAVIRAVKERDFGVALQYTNYRP